mmetsp:Transcript_22922/g.35294  ORF Transcript_22922/g.35294 Transcript_22922/m.35294 type:complete len:104 (-) Transcript_22922:225-536(-)
MDWEEGSIGILKWYDLFTLRGFFDYQVDVLHLFLFPWVSLILFLTRLFTGNWAWLSIQHENPVDMNRLFTGPDSAAYMQSGMSMGSSSHCSDSYDEECWKKNP